MSLAQHSPTIVAHADWSVDPRKRWVAVARRDADVWRLAAPVPVGEVATFLARLRAMADGGPVALGVDLPLGLPRAYAAGLPERDFLHFLTTTGDTGRISSRSAQRWRRSDRAGRSIRRAAWRA